MVNAPSSPPVAGSTRVSIRNLKFYYGTHQVLQGVSLDIPAFQVTALIGPSGCGKTTLLRCLNRMHDLYPGNRYEGVIRLQPGDTDILGPGVDPIQVRMRCGMVFQKPNPFPKSIYENVAYGLRLQGMNRRRDLDERVEKALREAALWEEVKSRL
ncbi:MAG: ATP-binding cassette domain-containing protein, partial [Verrucomicrobia bacterium]|nr:ATP-binding cassette domain-containing protein [Verrucomicrobiota bacterium]